MVLGVNGQRPDGCLRVSSDHLIMFKSMFFFNAKEDRNLFNYQNFKGYRSRSYIFYCLFGMDRLVLLACLQT